MSFYIRSLIKPNLHNSLNELQEGGGAGACDLRWEFITCLYSTWYDMCERFTEVRCCVLASFVAMLSWATLRGHMCVLLEPVKKTPWGYTHIMQPACLPLKLLMISISKDLIKCSLL